ncbi:MAG: 50S ribosomal protein L18 [Kosmotogaceae bacterium]
MKKNIRKQLRQRRHLRIRSTIKGTPERPRLAVFRSEKHMYAQIIDDTSGTTLAYASTVNKEIKEKLTKTWNKEAASEVGKLIAKKALEKGIKEVVFDRGGFKYHGRVKFLAEAARESGLSF